MVNVNCSFKAILSNNQYDTVYQCNDRQHFLWSYRTIKNSNKAKPMYVIKYYKDKIVGHKYLGDIDK